MNKLAMSTWVLGLSSMMLGALAVGCIGAPASDEETATEAPIARVGAPASDKEIATEAPIARIGAPASDEETAAEAPIAPEDRAAYAAEQMAKLKAEKEGTVGHVGKGGDHPEARDNETPPCCDTDMNYCCFFFDDGQTCICIGN